MRLEENKKNLRGKSINLALSERGLSALRATNLGLEETILNAGVPMRARMVHIGKEGKQMSQPYSVHGEVTMLLSRMYLSIIVIYNSMVYCSTSMQSIAPVSMNCC